MKFGLITAVVVMLLLAASVFFYVDITTQITADVQGNLEANTAGNAAEFEDWLDEYDQSLGTLTGSGVLATASDARATSELQQYRRTMPAESQHVHFLDFQSDDLIYTSDATADTETLSELQLQVYERSGDEPRHLNYDDLGGEDFEGGVTEVYERNGDTLVAFIEPVPGAEHTAVVLEADITAIDDRFDTAVEGESVQVVDPNAETVVYAENDSAILSAYQDGFHAEFTNDMTGTGVFENQDADSVQSYAGIETTEWVVVSDAPQSSAYALADNVATSLVLLIGIALAGFVVTGATIGRSTAAAMDDLASNASSLSRGDTEITVDETDRIDEVGQVQQSFLDTRNYLETAATQADAIARQEFDDPILEAEVPGKLGDSLETMSQDLEQYIDDIEASKAEAELAQDEAAEARKEAEALATRLEERAREFGDVMATAADGDLTQRLDEDVDNEALAEIATGFNGMLEDLERTIVDIQGLAEDVDQTSLSVTERVGEIERASDEVSRSTEEIASASADQSTRFQTVYGEMNDLSATVEEIASTASDVANVSQQTAEKATVAGEATDEIQTEMNQLEERAETITGQVGQLESEMGEISEIVDLIDDIADQTNLLALNASIEAASAGEEGDGFAVVASEVKALAEETGQATAEVDALIGRVQDSVDDTVTEIDRMRERVDRGATVVEDGIEAIDAIADQVETANNSIQSINEATDEQARASERVVTMVDEATEISTETQSETETVAAAVEEQTASISEVSAGAQSLTEMADDLRVSLDAFEVDGDSADTAETTSNVSEETDLVLGYDSSAPSSSE
nr:methyl-accepting chemotaxis protein [Natronolimnobius baerhuensis]